MTEAALRLVGDDRELETLRQEYETTIRRMQSRIDFLTSELEHQERANAALQVDFSNAEVDLRVKRSQVKQLKKERDEKDRADPAYEMCYKIWEYWKKQISPKSRKFSSEDFRAVRARLADTMDDGVEPAYGPRYICEAILGAKYDHNTSDTGKCYWELELICRSPKKLEDFHDRWVRYKERQARMNN